MVTTARVIGSGTSAQAATFIVGTTAGALITASGTVQADAIRMDHDVIAYGTVASGSGTILPASTDAGDTRLIKNLGANALLVYPPVGGVIDALSVNAAFSIPAGKACLFVRHRLSTNGDFWVSFLGA